MMSSCEAFLVHGKICLLPMQTFQRKGGGLAIRIGDNVVFFGPSGDYEGIEMTLANIESKDDDTVGITAEIYAALETAAGNLGKPPAVPYFQPGTHGHEAETSQ
jgi:hypothetical protein